MHTYCLLKDRRKMVVLSENTQEETMDVYPVENLSEYQSGQVPVTTNVRYDEIACLDSNRAAAFGEWK